MLNGKCETKRTSLQIKRVSIKSKEMISKASIRIQGSGQAKDQ